MVRAAALLAIIWLAAFGCSDGGKCGAGDNSLTCEGGPDPTAGQGGSGGAGNSSGGTVNSNGGSSGSSSGPGGKGPMIECPPECFRPINCVKTCGGPSLSNGCCPCVEPAFDDIQCGQGGSP